MNIADLFIIKVHSMDDVPVISRPYELTKMTEGTGLTCNTGGNGLKGYD